MCSMSIIFCLSPVFLIPHVSDRILIFFFSKIICAGHIDHSARLMRVITWNRSFRGLSNVDDRKDDFDSDEHETHATVLDKLLAWEKKLYEEVKVSCSVAECVIVKCYLIN